MKAIMPGFMFVMPTMAVVIVIFMSVVIVVVSFMVWRSPAQMQLRFGRLNATASGFGHFENSFGRFKHSQSSGNRLPILLLLQRMFETHNVHSRRHDQNLHLIILDSDLYHRFTVHAGI